MRTADRILIFGGIALALFGMLYGLYYAIFAEHQALDKIGGSLATAFVEAADRDSEKSEDALSTYRQTKYNYVRKVDVHSHWIGLAMLMIVLGVVFDEVVFGERVRLVIALAMLAGSVLFPLGVILQTTRAVSLASTLAIAGSGLVSLIISGGVVVTMNAARQVITDGAVAIGGDSGGAYAAKRMIAATGMILTTS